MATDHWALALAEVLYYSLALIPLLCVSYIHLRHAPFTLGWIFHIAFLLLQITGAALTVSAGKYGVPSTTAAILTGVGISPQLLGVAGVAQEWALLTGRVGQTKKLRTLTELISLVYHLAVAGGVAIYAIGVSGKSEIPPKENAESMAKAGIAILLVLWLALCAVVAFLALFQRSSTDGMRPLLDAVVVSLILLGIRMIYQTVAAVSNDPKYNSVVGKIGYAAGLQFVPSALVVAAMIVGGLNTSGAVKDSAGASSGLRHIEEARAKTEAGRQASY